MAARYCVVVTKGVATNLRDLPFENLYAHGFVRVAAATPAMLWLRLDSSADVKGTVQSVKETVVTSTGSQDSVPVTGLAVERATYQMVITTLLLAPQQVVACLPNVKRR